MAADLPEKLLIIARLAVATRGPLAEGARREARGRNETQVGDAGPEAPGQVRGNGPAEGESGKAQRSIPGEHLQEETMHEIQVLLARRLAWHRGRRAVRRMVQGVHREALGQRLDVPCPVPPAPHPAVEEHDVGSAPPRARLPTLVRVQPVRAVSAQGDEDTVIELATRLTGFSLPD